jgi:hypothetical protein
MQQPLYGTWIFSHIGFNRKKSDLTKYLSSKGSTLEWNNTRCNYIEVSNLHHMIHIQDHIWSFTHIRQVWVCKVGGWELPSFLCIVTT